ncbi:Domain of unknown function DUF1813 HSP20-like protein [Serratia sp. AS12]|uniref:SymE family type I addiction module toxin n=1 Tax=Serratia TaxID=613 RepID=UPI00020EA122|nr:MULTISPECIES: SymE family type I addiction module toxin [Serratia]AEF47597.1 Domain of unknown function DUF1813 HSP20-like protein [Serratia plymuthica AS9]AEF52549.1 Domain of unknown function DUF1813 HSP20-like protein [Serratia sp. AS12]AEG30256.1 Domain of unknown function DUF1813 HSP20-like protein [Serratia sp. AS13]UTN96254.1 type I toxin-antitoxin system SymE family toxin [Serratia plymuthica]
MRWRGLGKCGFRVQGLHDGYRHNGGRPNLPPQLTLTGQWLEPLGFTTGQKIQVITEPGQLIIRIAPVTGGTA